MGVLSVLGSIIKPVASIIDSLHTSDEEKSILQNELTKIENSFAVHVIDYESKIAEMQANVIMSEAKGESWLQRNWRPITMLTFLTLIVLHYCGVLAFEIADQMWVLLQFGIGGYVGGRSVEKIAKLIPAIVTKFKKG